MPIAEIDGNKLYYEDSGGDGPAIVFSHGGFLDHTMWKHQVSAFSPDHRVVTWDERGHGMSECNGPFDFWDAAWDVVGLLDSCGIDEAVCVGMSQGGWLSQRVALASPDRCRGLALCGTTSAPLSEQETEGYGQMAGGWQAIGPLGEIADVIAGIQFAGTDQDDSHWRSQWTGRPPSHWADPWNAILGRTEDLTDRLSEIACPVTFIHGTADAAFPVDVAHAMNEKVSDSRGVTVIEGGPHAAGLTHPEEFNAALRTFLAGL